MQKLRMDVNAMARDVLRIMQMQPESLSDVHELGICAFPFGMTHALSQLAGLSFEQNHALVILYLRDVFRFEEEKCASMSDFFIRSIDPDYNDTCCAIIHRGIDGHQQWSSGNIEELKSSIQHVISVLDNQ